MEMMSAAFDLLKNTVINKKRELSAQINEYYNSKKPSIADAVNKCEEQSRLSESVSFLRYL